MKALLITEQGCESFAEKELEKRFKIKSSNNEFEASEEQLARITYTSQTAKRVILLLKRGTFKNLEDMEKQLEDSLTAESIINLLKTKKFRINCERIGVHDFNSVEAVQVTGKIIESILETSKYKEVPSIDLKNPDLILNLQIQDNTYSLGLDLAGRDLSKRQYRVFNHPNNIKGTIAFSLLLFAEYEPGKLIADPFSLSGTIPIEAALYEANFPVNFYDKSLSIKKIFDVNFDDIDKEIKKPAKPRITSLEASFRNLTAQKKNAKIAGVEKSISFSRLQASDIDLKLKEKVDIVVGRLIEPTKHVSENRVLSIYEDFFKNVKQAIKKGSTLAFILRNSDLAVEEAKKQGFKFIERKDVHQGQQELEFIKLRW